MKDDKESESFRYLSKEDLEKKEQSVHILDWSYQIEKNRWYDSSLHINEAMYVVYYICACVYSVCVYIHTYTHIQTYIHTHTHYCLQSFCIAWASFREFVNRYLAEFLPSFLITITKFQAGQIIKTPHCGCHGCVDTHTSIYTNTSVYTHTHTSRVYHI